MFHIRPHPHHAGGAPGVATIAAAFGVALSTGISAQAPPEPRQHLSLQAATEALVARNLSVIAARYNVDLFRAQRVAAALKPDPTVVVSAAGFTLPRVLEHPQYAGFAVADNSVIDTQYSIGIEKVIERGGKRELRMAQADIETTAADAELANELRQQTFELKQAFLDGLLARENVRVLRENLQGFSRSQQVFAAQFQEGYTAGVDLRRLGIELVDLRGGVSSAEIDYVQRVRDVLNLIGDGDSGTPDRAAHVTPTASLVSAPPQIDSAIEGIGLDVLDGDLDVTPVDLEIAQLRALALANRPDLRAAQLRLDAADDALRGADATRIRDFTVGGQYMRSGPDNAVGIAVGAPLTTTRRASAAVAQATAARLQAEARLQQVRAQVLTDVEKAFAAYRIHRDRLELFDGQVLRQASEVRNIEQVAYREGERGLLSLLDAQRAYNQILVGYNAARHDVAVSMYQLEWATGTSAALVPGAAQAAFMTGLTGDRHE